MNIKQHNPMHPGAFIREVYLEPNQFDANKLADNLNIDHGFMTRIIEEDADIYPELAIRLSMVLGRSAESWLIMQGNYDLFKTKEIMNFHGYEKINFVSIA